MRWILLIVSLSAAGAGGQPLEYGAATAALGGAGAALSETGSMRLNPAALAATRTFFLMAGYSRSYGLSELDHLFAETGLPLGSATYGLAIESYGFEQFRQQTLHAALAGMFESTALAAGVAGMVQHRSIPGIPASILISGRAGFIAGFGDRLHIGVAVHRIVQSERAGDAGRIVLIGASVRPLRKLLFLIDAHKDGGFPVSIRSGLEFMPARTLSVRSGLSTAPETYSLGVGIAVGAVRVALAGQRHSVLGWSRVVDLRIAG